MSCEDALSEAIRVALECDTSEEDCAEVIHRRAAQLARLESDRPWPCWGARWTRSRGQ